MTFHITFYSINDFGNIPIFVYIVPYKTGHDIFTIYIFAILEIRYVISKYVPSLEKSFYSLFTDNNHVVTGELTLQWTN